MIESSFLRIMPATSSPALCRLALRSVVAAVIALSPLFASSECPVSKDLHAAEQLMKAGEFREAIALLSRAESAAPGCDPEQYHLLAIALLNAGENSQARETVERGLRAFPGSAPLQTYYVSVLSFTCSREEMSARLQKVIAADPGAHVLEAALGRTLFDLDPESERAGALLATAVRDSPRDVESRCYYAHWLCIAHREREAAALLDSAIEDAPPNPDLQVNIYRLKAIAEDRLDREDVADFAYRKAIEWNGRRSKPSYSPELEYAEFLMRRSRDASAAQVLRSLIAREPHLGPARFDLARVLAHENDYDAAIREATAALGDAPEVTEQKPIHVFLSRMLHSVGRDDQARAHEEWVASH